MMFITSFELGFFSRRIPTASEPVDLVPTLLPRPPASDLRRFGDRTDASAGLQ